MRTIKVSKTVSSDVITRKETTIIIRLVQANDFTFAILATTIENGTTTMYQSIVNTAIQYDDIAVKYDDLIEDLNR